MHAQTAVVRDLLAKKAEYAWIQVFPSMGAFRSHYNKPVMS